MTTMKKIKVAPGIYWVELPEAELYIQCGCPADSVKHLRKKGFIATEDKGQGVTCETGPNVILLSDVPTQKGQLANLAEFPVLQMLYRQGMILPGHPNNSGIKPLIIGLEAEVQAQSEYIYLGNYGLTSLDAIIKTGMPEKRAQDLLRLKHKFAFDNIQSTTELVDTLTVGSDPVEIRNGVLIRRKELNVYEISYQGQTLEIDLNLEPQEVYEASYSLDYHKLKRSYFSVVHNGEGDGWDYDRPCMGSIITFQDSIYLIDTGPHILYSLQALGIGVNEITGIFHTHAHDDHFNGLTALMRGDHRIKYYSTRLVRASVMKKLKALTSVDEQLFEEYFEVHDLEDEVWNNVEGMEVKPFCSPHPVETCVFFFRVLWGEGYKTYAHLADIASLQLLQDMVKEDPLQSGLSRACYEQVEKAYLVPVSLKKIDSGGGMIHGEAEDFRNDESEKILLSHSSYPPTDRQKEIGDTTSFGAVDILIPARRDYTELYFYKYFQAYFPGVAPHEMEMLLNCPVASFNPGTIIIRKGEVNENIYFILAGLLEYLDPERSVNNKLTAGSMAGELSGLLGEEARGTYRAISYVKGLQVDCNLYHEFLKRNGIFDVFIKNIEERYYLQNTWLFGEQVSCPLKSKIAQAMKPEMLEPGEPVSVKDKTGLFLLTEGELEIYSADLIIEYLKPGWFFGEEKLVSQNADLFEAYAAIPSRGYCIPSSIIDNIPIVQWKLREVFKTRMLKSIDAHAW